MKNIMAIITCSVFLMGMSPSYEPLTDGESAVRLTSDPGTVGVENTEEATMPPLKDGEATADHINVRMGPGVGYPAIAKLGKHTRVRILGSIRGWLVVLLPDDSVGMVSEDYVKITEPYIQEDYEGANAEEAPDVYAADISDAERLFSLVNGYRSNFGLPAYENDKKLNEAACLKAADMAMNSYFNHDSPIYGTPFSMLRNMGVFYKTASENLAHTVSVTEAFTKMTGNLAHRTNLVSQRYTNMGIGVSDDVNDPGKKLIVLLFTEL